MIKASLKSALPAVSVIVPTLNEEKYLEPTLVALRNQSYNGSVEIIVADGGSTDKTRKIAEDIADMFIVAPKGIARGRNAGAKAASGDILVFVDADTILQYNTVLELVKAVQHNGVFGATCPVLPTLYKESEFLYFRVLNRATKMSIKSDPHVATVCVAYRRSAFERAGGFNEKMDTYEDSDLSRRIGKIGKIRYVETTAVFTSPRRIRAWGSLKTWIKYGLNGIRYELTGEWMKEDEYLPIR